MRKELNEVRSDSSMSRGSRDPAPVAEPVPKAAGAGYDEFVSVLKQLASEVKELKSDTYVTDLGRRIMSDVAQRRQLQSCLWTPIGESEVK